MKTFLFFLLSFVAYKETRGLDISTYFEPCSLTDPNINQCIKETGQKLIPKFVNGVKELKLGPIDPWETAEATFTENSDGNDLVIHYKNIVQTGFSGIQIEGSDVDLQHGVMTFKLLYPRIVFTADYECKGGLLGFQVEGNGKANVSVWNAYSSFVLKYHVVDDHIKINSVIIGFSFDKIYLDYTNLMVNGDKELSDSASTFINENSAEIIEGLKPQLEKFYAKLTGEFLQTVFDAVPYSTLFKTT